MLHISELADHKVENPEDVVKVGDELEVKVLRVDTDDRKIGLSRRRVDWTPEEEAAEAKKEAAEGGGATTTSTGAPKIKDADLKGGLGGGGLLIDTSSADATPAETPAAEAPAAEAEPEPTAEATPEEPAAEPDADASEE